MRRPLAALLVATLLGAALLVGCTGTPGGSAKPAGNAAPGDPAPTLAGTSLDGAALDIKAFRGRPVVVNFWASWCIPCRDEFPLFRDELGLHHADGLAVIGVVFNDDDAAARSFLSKFGATWPSLTDPGGTHASGWRVVAPPQTYFIGRDGVIRSRQIGEVTKVDFERQLAAILK